MEGDERLPDKKGYGFDGCSPNILMARAEVRKGRIAFPEGTSYRLMVLPNYETMTPQLLAKITDLVKAGATVVGSPPVKSPSLSNYPACDQEVQLLVKELWGGLKTPKEVTRRGYGHGNIYWGGGSSEKLYPDYNSTAAVLKEMGISDDFTATGPVRYGHRRSKEREIYFLSNESDKPIQVDCTFRVATGQPQLWSPVSGEKRALPQFKRDNGLTTIPMKFEPYESFFVIFPCKDLSKVKSTNSNSVNFPKTKSVSTLEGSWKVSFNPKLGGPKKVNFDLLQDWTSRKEEGIKYYSGLATYRKSFASPAGLAAGSHIWLDLGKVHEMARVRLNGKEVGVVWCAPWHIEISSALQAGDNLLEIEVANLWPNRLIGDAAQPPEKRITWTIISHPYNTGSKLLPSGLIGPVRILVRQGD